VIDVVIPTVAGREDSLARCIESYERNAALSSINVIVIRDETTCGRAWIEGMKQSRAPYIHLTCDDLEMTNPMWGGVCVETVDAGQLPCPIVRCPDGSLESCGGDMSALDCLISEMRSDRTLTDFSVLPFMSREQASKIGMIRSHYLSDTWVSHRGRQFGYQTVVRHGYELIHHRSNVKRIAGNPEDYAIFNHAMSV